MLHAEVQGPRVHFNLWTVTSKVPSRALGFPGGSDGKESACKVGDLGWEDPLERGMITHSSIPGWRFPMDRGAWRATVDGLHRVEQE